jgi:hypothetical protein
MPRRAPARRACCTTLCCFEQRVLAALVAGRCIPPIAALSHTHPPPSLTARRRRHQTPQVLRFAAVGTGLVYGSVKLGFLKGVAAKNAKKAGAAAEGTH